jgi:type III restriction enzyme
MAVKTLKTFQERAIDSAVVVFDHARRMLDAAAEDQEGRATAIHDNGYLLIEAPTGAGKTLMAGHIVERVSALDRVVWFWFAPFKGVVDQSAAFLREQFHGLRLRTLGEDRSSIGTRTGDVFVTTWQLVATRIRDRRSVRQTSEQNDSVDDMVGFLREQGFRIGAVVDEAHHGFHGETQAAVFFRTVLKPEYTVLVTATPDDTDLRDLEERMQIGNIHRISVSRADAVGPGPGAGLIKNGIKCIAWRVDEGAEALVDFEMTALREGATLHRFLKGELNRVGINLTPLMLVQVDSKPKSVERAKERLLSLGFKETQVATHTSEEPDAGLLALANDESREVLIFKMAVALGFDAPRAWTLVSMRAARDEDFGVQLVGRILRVHRRLQGKTLPDALKYGYVLLADMETQGGLDAAGQRINRLQTVYATVSPTTVVLRVGDRDLVQSVGPNGQMTFIPAPPVGAMFTPPPPEVSAGSDPRDQRQATLFATAWAPEEFRDALRVALSTPPQVARYQYSLRSGVPRKFRSQEFSDDREITEEDCAERFVVSAAQLLDALMSHERVRVQKRTLEIFTREIQMELGFAPPSLEQMQRKAQAELLRSGIFSAKELRRSLMRRLHIMLAERGIENADNSERLSEYLDVLLSQHPELLREAQKAAMAAAAEVRDTAEIPERIDSETPLEQSRWNAYGVYPSSMNSWERGFTEYLDADDSGTVLWWHRNPARKGWSINVLLESGRSFYPDFIVGIRQRPREDNGLLADTKYAYETTRELPKLLAEHASYGRVLILSKDSSAKWAIAELDSRTGAARLAGRFRIAEAATY